MKAVLTPNLIKEFGRGVESNIFHHAPLLIIALLLFLTGCTKPNTGRGDDERSSKIENEIKALKEQVSHIGSINEELKLLKDQITIEQNLYNKSSQKILELELEISALKSDEVDLDLSSKAFQSVDTRVGKLLVSVLDVQPFIDGYKIKLHIGNPNAVTFVGIKISSKWGKKVGQFFHDNKDARGNLYVEWQRSLQKKDFSITENLLPGRWNPVEIILNPAGKDAFGYVSIKITSDTISLYQETPSK